MALAYVTVTGAWDDGSGQGVTGTVTFAPSETVYSAGQQVVTPAAPVSCPVVNGRLLTASGGPVQLLATDNTGLTLMGRTGFWFWTASVNIGGGVAGKADSFSFFLPYSGSPVDLYSLANQVLSDFPNPLTALGDLMAGGAGGSPQRLAGNVTAAREFLVSQGTGSAAQAPAWGALQAGDVPSLPYAPQTSGSALLKGNGSGGFAAASPGTDYLAPNGSGAALTGITEGQVSGLTADLAARAPLANPVFTGTVTVPATVGATDAAQKAYVDSVAQGLDNKPSVTVLAASNITLSGTQTIDGVAVTAGQRVLATGQTAASQNGIWTVAAGAWARPADFAAGSTQLGASVFAEAGTANGSSGWVLTGASAVTVDTSAQTWTQFSGAGEVTAGTGLTKAGNTLSVTPGTYDAAGAASAAQAAATAGATVMVPKPTGVTAADTPNVTAAITALTTALASGPATLLFQDGAYQVDSNSAVIRSVSNFAVRSAGRTVIAQAPNRSGLPNNVTGDLFIIADCTDFTVEGITFDGMRDTVSPLTPLTATASSGQPSVTVASGNGSRYQVGQRLSVLGGFGTADAGLASGNVNGWGGSNLVVSSITPGGGSGGGDLITFTANLSHTFTSIGGAAYSDGFGPYAYGGAYVSPYQTAFNNTVAGRTLSGEDQQCGLHLMNCQRFTLQRVTARNVWESPIKLGTGFSGANANSSIASISDGCTGAVTQCTALHGYDQGISMWFCNSVTVSGCYVAGAGWAGISMSMSDHCTVTGNVSTGNYYVPAGNQQGSGIAVEGGQGNIVSGNVLTNNYQCGIFLWKPPGVFNFGLPDNSGNPTLGAFIPADTAAGTSIQVSSSADFTVNGRYSIADQERTEAVTVASVVDGTHITLTGNTAFPHASGCYFSIRVPADNIFADNLIDGSQISSAIFHQSAVRSKITGNRVKNWNSASGGNQGLNMFNAAVGGTILAGDGTTVSGNTFGPPGPTGNHAVLIDSSGSHVISGNTFAGFETGGTNPLKLQGVYDTTVSGNVFHDIGDGTGSAQQGIYLTTGSSNGLACKRVTVTGNVVTRAKNEGILVLGGDSLTITANKVSSCGGNAGIDLRGVTNSVVSANVANSNSAAGIKLENNSGTGCTGNRVTGNTCRDDGTGYNVQTGATWTQQNGIIESGNSNFNIFTGNECDSNASAQLTTAGANSSAFANVISGVMTGAPLTSQDYAGLFGDGSDGSATLDGTATVSWASKSGSTYTMTRDCFLTSLTINGGVTLATNGWRVFCAGTVTNGGTVSAPGSNAGSSTGAGHTNSGSMQGGQAGGSGATGNGSNGTTPPAAIGTGNGGAGGAGSNGTGGSTVVSHIASAAQYRVPAPVLSGAVNLAGAVVSVGGAPGGSGGAGDGTNAGGGGGSGGSIIVIFAWAVVNNGTVTAAGGNGFTPVTGNCGGGGGGGGGLILVYTLTAWTAGTTSVSGGTHGSGVGTGAAGSDGTAGTVLNVIVQ